MKPNFGKLTLSLLAAIYFIWLAIDPTNGSFLDLVDLPIHEAGHLLFGVFGQFVGVAGGTLLQLIVPAAFVIYFIWNNKPYSAAIVLFWLGQSILNVWQYESDAVVMQIVLLNGSTGSEGAFHDWNYLLVESNLLGQTYLIAAIIRCIGTLTILAAAGFSVYYSFEPKKEK